MRKSVQSHMQTLLFDRATASRLIPPFTIQLLKWVGNKQRFAHEIVSYFPVEFGKYFEPFLGSGAVLGTLAPDDGVGSDAFGPLAEIWQTLRDDPRLLVEWYSERWQKVANGRKVQGYEQIKASYMPFQMLRICFFSVVPATEELFDFGRTTDTCQRLPEFTHPF